MPLFHEVVLVLLFFVTSVVGVVTGSNSLITVPVMFQFGIDPKVAVATNMFGLTFMSLGGSIPFLRRGSIDLQQISPLIFLTVISSALGALLAGSITSGSLKLIVSAGMICVALFTLIRQDAGIKPTAVSRKALGMTFVLSFLLGVYGGLYSGGYVTLLTAVLVAFFGMTFSEAVASTKVINIFSSGVATAVFIWQGLVDFRLGIVLAITSFVGAFVGAHYAAKLNDLWLKRIFLATVFILAIKTLFDFF